MLVDDPVDLHYPNSLDFQFVFFQVPMPSYLIAIVAGLIESRDIGPRTRVWSEKEFVDIAANEFDEVHYIYIYFFVLFCRNLITICIVHLLILDNARLLNLR